MDKKAVLDLFKTVESYDDLKALFDTAETAGFYLGSYWDAHNKHLAKIVSRNNPLGLEVPRFLSNPSQADSNNYKEFEEKVIAHFAQFGIDTAIQERMQNVHIQERYASYPRKKTREEVIAMGYTPHPDASPENSWYAYDLSKPLKLRFVCDHYEFNRLLELIGGPELPYYSEYSFPENPETDQYIIHPNRKVQFKDEALATRLRDLLAAKYQKVSIFMVKL